MIGASLPNDMCPEAVSNGGKSFFVLALLFTSSQRNFPLAFQKIRAHLWSEMKHGKFQQMWLNFFGSSDCIKEQKCVKMVDK